MIDGKPHAEHAAGQPDPGRSILPVNECRWAGPAKGMAPAEKGGNSDGGQAG